MLTAKAAARKRALALKSRLAKAAELKEQERLEAIQNAKDAHELVEALEEIADAPIIIVDDRPAPEPTDSTEAINRVLPLYTPDKRPWYKRMWD